MPTLKSQLGEYKPNMPLNGKNKKLKIISTGGEQSKKNLKITEQGL